MAKRTPKGPGKHQNRGKRNGGSEKTAYRASCDKADAMPKKARRAARIKANAGQPLLP